MPSASPAFACTDANIRSACNSFHYQVCSSVLMALPTCTQVVKNQQIPTTPVAKTLETGQQANEVNKAASCFAVQIQTHGEPPHSLHHLHSCLFRAQIDMPLISKSSSLVKVRSRRQLRGREQRDTNSSVSLFLASS